MDSGVLPMYSYQDSDDRVPLLQMNSELQHAQLELLSAHCAIHQLRLHYSADDLARFGRRDVLRKSAEAANALNEFYSAIAKKIPQADQTPAAAPPSSQQIYQAVGWLSSYLQQQREHYFPLASPLPQQHKARMWPYFSAPLLEQIRILELQGTRVAAPEFFADIRALGFEPPPISHMDSLTFLDVVVFNEQLTERSLFHALVHAVQIQ